MNSGTHILVVDDDRHIRELVSMNLEARGYRVSTASDGGEALKRMSEETPALVILDVGMPVADGWQVCKAIRDHRVLSRAKVLILTCRATERDRMIGMHIFDADGFMAKPFDIDELTLSVDGLLNGRG